MRGGGPPSPPARRNNQRNQAGNEHSNITPPKAEAPLSPAQSKSTDTNTPPPFLGLMFPTEEAIHHPAGSMLKNWALAGCPVDCGDPWTVQQMQAAIDKGAHPSARVPEAAKACRLEALEEARDGMCKIVAWEDIKHNPPENLKISPIGAVPHKSRKYRMILDLSFKIRHGKHRTQSVNDSSDKSLAPQHSMYELGNVIPRIIHTMANAPDSGVPFVFSKLDLKDGYWRMVVHELDAWNFCFVLPPENEGDPVQLVVPDSLQMGWSESPPFFCAATETARDLAAAQLRHTTTLPPHDLEESMMAIDWSSMPSATQPLTQLHDRTLLEVFLDDFIAIVQSTNEKELRRLSRILLHNIHKIFPGPEITGSNLGPPISKKKLEAEGPWSTRKEVLGWLLDGVARTIQLPESKATKITQALKTYGRREVLSLKEFQEIHGKLQFTTIAIPIGRALLGPMDTYIANAGKARASRILVNKTLKGLSQDWRALLRMIAKEPTHVKELIEHPPSHKGFVDASKWGVGGVWFSGSAHIHPVVWFFKWPDSIASEFCSRDNPKGSITISDLELAGIFLHYIVLQAIVKRHRQSLNQCSVAIWCDNLPAVAWTYKFRASTSKLAARILRALAVRMHIDKAALPHINHIAGSYNIMADFASRHHSTCPQQFLTEFSSTFKPPQGAFWTLFRLNKNTTSKLCSELLQQPSTLESWKRLRRHAGEFGRLGTNGSYKISNRCPTSFTTSHERTKLSYWLPSPSMCDREAFHPKNNKFAPKLSKWRFPPSPRQQCWLDNQIPWEQRKAAIQRNSNSFSPALPDKTHRHNTN